MEERVLLSLLTTVSRQNVGLVAMPSLLPPPGRLDGPEAQPRWAGGCDVNCDQQKDKEEQQKEGEISGRIFVSRSSLQSFCFGRLLHMYPFPGSTPRWLPRTPVRFDLLNRFYVAVSTGRLVLVTVSH